MKNIYIYIYISEIDHYASKSILLQKNSFFLSSLLNLSVFGLWDNNAVLKVEVLYFYDSGCTYIAWHTVM